VIRHFCDRCERQTPTEADRHSVDVSSSSKSLGAYTLCSRCLTSLEQFFKEKPDEPRAKQG
jgi:hypothetical protein